MPYIKQELRTRLEHSINMMLIAQGDAYRDRNLDYTLFRLLSRGFCRSKWHKFWFSLGDIIRWPTRHLINGDTRDLCLYLSGELDDSPDIQDLEGILNYIGTELLNKTLCAKMQYKNINRLIGILARVEDTIGRRFRYHKYIYHMLGVLRCIGLEFYARRARPYETVAAATNGDIDYYKNSSSWPGI